MDRALARSAVRNYQEQANGGKSFDALIKHVAEDSLVLWGWHPGGNREPVPVPHDELVARFKQWAAAGGRFQVSRLRR